MDLYLIESAIVILVAFVYMLYDLLNNRNVPTIFVYATVGIGILFTILNANLNYALESFGIAAVVIVSGYFLLYKPGSLGLGDILEFGAISLMLTVQNYPLLTNNYQYGMPFIFSLFISSGIAALIIVPLYYVPMAVSKSKKSVLTNVKRSSIIKSMVIAAAYLMLMGVLSIIGFLGLYGIIIVGVLMMGSVFTTLFEETITHYMVSFLPVKKVLFDDIIALNMIDAKTLRMIKKNVPEFGRLATGEVIKKLGRTMPKLKIPIYTKPIPFAVFIFVGAVVSVLFGNLFFFVFR